MKHRFLKLLCFVLLSLLADLFAGCAVSRQPLYMSPAFHQDKIANLLVLSVADLRFDKSTKLAKLETAPRASLYENSVRNSSTLLASFSHFYAGLFRR